MGKVLKLDLEDLLGCSCCGTGGVHKWCCWVYIGVWSPESLSSASIELRYRCRKFLVWVTFNTAHLEATTGTPIFTGLNSTNRRVERWTEGFQNIYLECTRSRVFSGIVGNVRDVI